MAEAHYAGEAIVDNTGLGTNNRRLSQRNTSDSPTGTVDTTQTTQEELSTLVANLQRLAQEWECLLFSTGGLLVFTSLEVGQR
jgi:hypothetical protein